MSIHGLFEDHNGWPRTWVLVALFALLFAAIVGIAWALAAGEQSTCARRRCEVGTSVPDPELGRCVCVRLAQ